MQNLTLTSTNFVQDFLEKEFSKTNTQNVVDRLNERFPEFKFSIFKFSVNATTLESICYIDDEYAEVYKDRYGGSGSKQRFIHRLIWVERQKDKRMIRVLNPKEKQFKHSKTRFETDDELYDRVVWRIKETRIRREYVEKRRASTPSFNRKPLRRFLKTK